MNSRWVTVSPDVQQAAFFFAHLLHDGGHFRRNWQALAI
jgi:hypothetical protein